MRTEAALEEWRALYEVAVKLKELKPWQELSDMDSITILPHGKEEACVCSAIGRSYGFYAIAVHNGTASIADFFTLLESKNIPEHQLVRYQNNIMCYFGDRNELTSKELKLIKELGLKFRGKNNWIYFRVFEPGYAPYMPDKSEVLELTDIFKQLYMAVKALHRGLKIDFENGKTLFRMFDDKSNMWLNYEAPMLVPKLQYLVPVLKDEVLMRRLKNQPSNKITLQLDIAYLNAEVRDKNYDKPIVPRLFILADARSGMILSQEGITPGENEASLIFNCLIDYILQMGKPKKIMVRDMKTSSALMDLCKELDIKTQVSGKLAAIDEFVESFNDYNF